MKTGRQKRIAVINDFSGFGRCSLTVSIPVISASGIQTCALPTAIFSNHTGYEDYYFDDYTDKMRIYYSKWKKLGLTFDGIYTGFLGSAHQTDIVMDFIRDFSANSPVVIVDPVMGDDGHTYATLTDDLCRRLGRLASMADIVTPNLTEACILAGMPYDGTISDESSLGIIASRIKELGSGNVVITGIECDDGQIGNYILENDGSSIMLRFPTVGCRRAGTGDVFSSVLAAEAVNGVPLRQSVKKAAEFVAKAADISQQMSVPPQDGLCFEPLLGTLSE